MARRRSSGFERFKPKDPSQALKKYVPQGMSLPKAPPRPSQELLSKLQQALVERRPLSALYSKKRCELSPIALGKRDGEFRLWAFQAGGESTHKAKCFVVAKLSKLRPLDGEWQALEQGPVPDNCMTEVLQHVGEPPAQLFEPTF
jgi:hypothetical protein